MSHGTFHVFLLFLYFQAIFGDFNATISVSWTNVLRVSQTTTTLQVVVNPMLRQGSPMHDNIFYWLNQLGADYVRFVPWLPYPRLGVAELEPPTGNPRCGFASEEQSVYLSCPGFAISSVDFVSFGTPSGSCGNYAVGNCDASGALEIVTKACLGQTSCNVTASRDIFGDPCPNVPKQLAVQVSCYPSINSTSWDFTFIDPIMDDFMTATKNHSTIINFSTTPQWMWNTNAHVDYPADPNEVFWSYEQGTELRDPSMKELGDYYARLVSWYTKGGFTDEYGVYHSSGHYYNIPWWEVLNEVEAEHSMSVEYYTQVYDAIVSSILSVQPSMKFVGMALAFHKEYDWYYYFLDSDNHLPNIPLDMISFHFYGSPDQRTSVQGYEQIFEQTDDFIKEVHNITKIRDKMSPNTMIDIDEIGVILPDDNVLIPDPIPQEYWNACGAMYAYLVGSLSLEGVDLLGQSQLVGYPTQFPSVTELEWEHGNPTARYWVLKILIDNFKSGSSLLKTSSSSDKVFALGFLTPSGNRNILLVNKKFDNANIKLTGINTGTIIYSDTNTNYAPPVTTTFSNGAFTLGPWSVAILSNMK